MATVKINGKTFRPPKKRVTNSLMLDEKYTGEEPIFSGVEFKDESERRVALMRAFYYYNYFNSGKQFKKDVIKYAKDELKYDKEKLELLAISPDWGCEIQSGSLLRMRSRGLNLRDNEFAVINRNVEKMVALGVKKVKQDIADEEDPNVQAKAPIISVQDRVKAKVNETVITELEGLLDEWIMGNSPEANTIELMKAAILPAQAVKYVVDWADKRRAELQEAIDKLDPQLVEAYSHLSVKRKKEFIGWYEGIITDAQRFGTNTKTVRKARTKKPVSLEKQLSKLKYLKESPENKLVSINPSQIIGATELWTYNIKYKALSRYIAESGVGFEIKGTTLTKYDQSTSLTRKLRKPEQTLAEVLTSAQTKAAKVFDALTTKPSVPNGRMNEDTIILKAKK
jgi:hypothetical protein